MLAALAALGVVVALVLVFDVRQRVHALEVRLERDGRVAPAAPVVNRVRAVPAPPMITAVPAPVLSSTAPPPTAPTRPAVAAPSPRAIERTETDGALAGFEYRLGTVWLGRVGALVLILGLGFLAKFSFDHGWVSPAVRVGAGLLTGLALAIAGHRLVPRFPVPAQGLVATGIAALYLSVYAGHALYALVGQPLALLAMSGITAGALALALRHEALALAVLATFGGFLTPMVLGGQADGPWMLFAYLAVLDAGVLASAWWRRWTVLYGLGFIGTQTLYWSWLSTDTGGRAEVVRHLAGDLCGAILFLLLFAAVVPVLAATGRLSDAGTSARMALEFLAAGVAVTFFAAGWALLGMPSGGLAVLCFSAAGVYLVIVRTMHRTAPDDRLLLVHGAIALAFLVVGPAAWLDLRALVVAWSVEGVALLAIGAALDERRVRGSGLAVFGLAIAAFLVNSPRSAGTWLLDLPTLALGAGLLLGAGLYRRVSATGREAAVPAALVVAAIDAVAWLLTRGLMSDDLPSWVHSNRAVLVTLTWAAAVAVTLAVARREPTRFALTSATAVLLVVMILAVLDSLRGRAPGLPVANLRFVEGLVVAGLCLAYARVATAVNFAARQTRATLIAAGRWAAGVVLLWTLSAEVLLMPLPGWWFARVLDARQTALSVLWTVYALLVVTLGMRRGSRGARLGGLGLFGVTVVKVFVIDLAGLDAIYRILSFVGVGALLLLASFLYVRAVASDTSIAHEP